MPPLNFDKRIWSVYFLRTALKRIPTFYRRLKLSFKGYRIQHKVELGKSSIEAEFVEIGNGVVIEDGVRVCGLKELRLGHHTKIKRETIIQGDPLYKASFITGENCWIGPRCYLNVSRDVSLGNNVCVAANSSLWTHGTFAEIAEGYPYSYGSINIEDGAWIATGVIILPGVTVGKNSIVNAGSVVVKDVPQRTLCAGNPARILKKEEEFRHPIQPSQKMDFIRETFLRELIRMGFSIEETDKDRWRCRYLGFCFYFILSGGSTTNLPKGKGIVVGQGFEGNLSKKYTYFDLATKTYKPRNTWAEHLFIRIIHGRCILRFVSC